MRCCVLHVASDRHAVSELSVCCAAHQTFTPNVRGVSAPVIRQALYTFGDCANT
jgi:hypothetical protein